MKKLRCNPIAVTADERASKYVKEHNTMLSVRGCDDYADFLNDVEMPVDAVVIHGVLLDLDEFNRERVLKSVLKALKPAGRLILNTNGNEPFTVLKEVLGDYFCEYKTEYRTDTRDTFLFSVWRRRGDTDE